MRGEHNGAGVLRSGISSRGKLWGEVLNELEDVGRGNTGKPIKVGEARRVRVILGKGSIGRIEGNRGSVKVGKIKSISPSNKGGV